MTNWQTQCEQLWGEHWKLALSLMAGVNKRTVQRWNSGQVAIPDWIVEAIDETWKVWRG